MSLDPRQEAERAIRDRQATAYDGFFPEWRVRAETDAVLRILRRAFPRGLSHVVDLGTGTGRMPRALRGWASAVTAVDFSAASLEVARRSVAGETRTDYRWLREDATRTTLAEGCADAVTSLQVLQHLPTPALRNALFQEAHRLLRPGGVLVLTCYGRNMLHRLRGEREHDRGGLFVRRHSPSEVRSLATRQFPHARARGCVGLPDLMPFPELDRLLAYLPGWGWLSRVVVCSARKPGHPKA